MYVARAEKDKETRFRNLPAVFICARIEYLPSVAVGTSTTVFPGFLRAILLPLRSIILLGVVLPSLPLVSRHGLSGFRHLEPLATDFESSYSRIGFLFAGSSCVAARLLRCGARGCG